MTTFSVRFLGCKVSFTDADALRENLLAAGHEEAGAAAEVAFVNTCCVTSEALGKSRQAVARAARMHRRVFVTGCGANLEGAFAALPENVSVLAGGEPRAPERLLRLIEGEERAVAGASGGEPRPPACPPASRRVRAFVQIQDGCSFRCSYCIVPLVRGPGRSRTAADVLAEIRRRVAQGHKEVVLSGINLGSFRDASGGPGPGPGTGPGPGQGTRSLAGLVRAAGETPDLKRLRLSSIEINHVNADLVAALRETPAACRHLHIPLQSGDDRILRAMARRYDAATFLRRLEGLDDFNITTDAIVGFPGEDEAAFGRTLEVVEQAGITKVHVFRYSPRPGTAVCGKDDVPATVKKERAARLREASKNACISRWSGKIGMEENVLIDRPGRGYASDYTPWLVNGPVGDFVRARAESVGEQGISGTVGSVSKPERRL